MANDDQCKIVTEKSRMDTDLTFTDRMRLIPLLTVDNDERARRQESL
jgi:hypothetical protein